MTTIESVLERSRFAGLRAIFIDCSARVLTVLRVPAGRHVTSRRSAKRAPSAARTTA